MTAVMSVDARTGQSITTVAQESTGEQVGAACARAAAAFPALEAMGRSGRAGPAAGDGRRRWRPHATQVVAGRRPRDRARRAAPERRADPHVLPAAPVRRRRCDEGSYLEATIDHAGPTPMGPRPDLRRMLVPLGPVAVFGASNFPLAFSVPGGDTASALAAGCPVVLKAHPSTRPPPAVLRAARRGRTGDGAPEGTLGLVHGAQAGRRPGRPPRDPRRGLHRLRSAAAAPCSTLANARPDPIPFYAEMGSLNPLVVTPAAATERAAEIAEGYVGSFTLGRRAVLHEAGPGLRPGR